MKVLFNDLTDNIPEYETEYTSAIEELACIEPPKPKFNADEFFIDF